MTESVLLRAFITASGMKLHKNLIKKLICEAAEKIVHYISGRDRQLLSKDYSLHRCYTYLYGLIIIG